MQDYHLSDFPAAGLWFNGECITFHIDALIEMLPPPAEYDAPRFGTFANQLRQQYGNGDFIPSTNVAAAVHAFWVQHLQPEQRNPFTPFQEEAANLAKRFAVDRSQVHLFTNGLGITITAAPELRSRCTYESVSVLFDDILWCAPESVEGRAEIHSFLRDLEGILITEEYCLLKPIGRPDHTHEGCVRVWSLSGPRKDQTMFVVTARALRKCEDQYREARMLRHSMRKLRE